MGIRKRLMLQAVAVTCEYPSLALVLVQKISDSTASVMFVR